MRTTLNIDDDLMATARSIAARDRRPVGAVISTLLRRAIEPRATTQQATRNGIPLFPISPDARIVTPESIKELLEES